MTWLGGKRARFGKAYGCDGIAGDSAVTSIQVFQGFGTLIFNADEQAPGSSGHFEGSYNAFPGFASLMVNGQRRFVIIQRRAAIHGLTVVSSSLRGNYSDPGPGGLPGQQWLDRLNEIVIEDQDNDSDAIDARPSDPYSPSVMRLSTGELMLKYERDYNELPTRRTVTRRSTDGITWDAPVQLPLQQNWQYTSAGGKIVELPNGDLLSFDYYRETGQSRYTSFCSRSTDRGNSWQFLSIVAQDPVSASNRQYEEPQGGRLRASGRILVLIRVDNIFGPGGGDPTIDGRIFATHSDDQGQTWSALRIAFPGLGWPAWIELANGVLVAITRELVSRRPQLWFSLDGGFTWGFERIFGDDRLYDAVAGGGHGNGGYMYGDLEEVRPNVIGVAYGQDSGGFGSVSYCKLIYQEFGINVSPEIPYRKRLSAYWDATSSACIRYGAWNGLNGLSRATFVFRVRHNQLGTIQGGYWARNNNSDRQLRAYQDTSGRFVLGVATGASTEIFVTYPAGVLLNDTFQVLMVVLDLPAVSFYVGGQAIAPESVTGTLPNALRTAGSMVTVGAGSDAPTNIIRLAYLHEVLVFPGVAASLEQVAEFSGVVPINPLTSSLAAFLEDGMWVNFEGDFEDRMGNAGAASIVGPGPNTVELLDIWTPGPSYLPAPT